MDCKTVCRKLSAYYDGELPQRELAAVEEHLRGCAACRQELALFGKNDALMKSVPPVKVSPDFRARFWEKVRREQVPARGLLERLVMRFLPVPALASATIVLFLAFSVLSPALYGVTNHEAKKELSAIVADALAPVAAKNVFGPAAFAALCDDCRQMLCKCCKECTGSVCPMKE